MSLLDTYRKTPKILWYRTCVFVNFYFLFTTIAGFSEYKPIDLFSGGWGLLLGVKSKLRNAWAYFREAYFWTFTLYIYKVGLYRDDGLACFGNINGSQAERIRKEFISIFKTEFKLNITSEANLKIVNFLDVTLNSNTGTQELYNKPNNNPLYININSNHPKKKYTKKNKRVI